MLIKYTTFLIFLNIFFNFNLAIKETPTEEDIELIFDVKSSMLLETRSASVDENPKLSPEQIKFNQEWLINAPDAKILNFLRFNDNDVEKSINMLEKSLEWRYKNKIDKLLTYEPPQWILDNFPFRLTGFTDDGYPVMYVDIGNWKAREALQLGYRGDIVKTIFSVIEKGLNEANARLPENNEVGIGKFYIIVNWENLSLYTLSSIRVLSLFGSVVGLLEKHYPEGAVIAYCINTPGYFSTVTNILKQVLSSKSLEMVRIFESNEDWRDEVFKELPKSAIPKILGGDS